MLAAAPSQSTFATEICGLFISWAGAAPAISSARPASMARFKTASLALPVSQGLTFAAELKASNSGIQGLHSGVGCGANVQRTCVQDGRLSGMTVREANLTPASSADREPEMIESGGTA